MTARTWPPCLMTLFIFVVFRDEAMDFAHEPLPPIPGSESADHNREPDERDRAPDERDRATDDKGTARFSSVSVENESGIGLDDSAGESDKLVPGSDEQRAKVNRKNNVVVGQPISPSKNGLEPRYSHGSHERMETAVWSGLRVEPGFPTFRRIEFDLELLLRKRVDKNSRKWLRLLVARLGGFGWRWWVTNAWITILYQWPASLVTYGYWYSKRAGNDFYPNIWRQLTSFRKLVVKSWSENYGIYSRVMASRRWKTQDNQAGALLEKAGSPVGD